VAMIQYTPGHQSRHPVLTGVVGTVDLCAWHDAPTALEVFKMHGEDIRAFDRVAKFIGHPAGDHPHSRQGKINILDHLTSRDFERLAELLRTSLSVAKTEIAAPPCEYAMK
jgi:hypothetical protein